MNKLNIKLTASLAVALFAGFSVFYACKKEENTFKSPPMSSELKMLYGNLPSVDFGNITLLNGEILKFESFEHYEQVYEDLLMLYETWNDLFFATYDSIPDDKLDDLIRQLGFDEYLPLLKFEEIFGIAGNNLRSEIVKAEEKWLLTSLNGISPFDEIVPCPVEQTLFSKWHEIAIGDTICQMRGGCFEIYIPVKDIQYINIIRNVTKEELRTKAAVPGLPNNPPYYSIDEDGNNNSGCYKSDYSKPGQKILNPPYNNIRLDWFFKYEYRNFLADTRTTVIMWNYKKVNGVWEKNRKAVCALGSVTKLYNAENGCDELGYFNKPMNTPGKAFKRTKRRCFAFFDVYPVHQKCDPNESRVLCHLDGVNYTFNALTGERIY